MRALLLAALLSAPAAAADIQAEMLESERRLMGAVLADSAKNAEYQADCAAADDAAKKPALILKWRAAAAEKAQAYAAAPPASNPDGKSLKEMMGAEQWSYLMATLRLMEGGFMKDTVIGMIEKADADLAGGDPERAEAFIKMAQDKAKEDITEYQKTQQYKDGLTEAARRRDEKAKEQAKESQRKLDAAKNAKEQAERAVKDGTTFDGGGAKKDEVVVVPGGADQNSSGGGTKETSKEKITLTPSKDRPNLAGPGKIDVPAPTREKAETDDMAELRGMKKGKGGFMGILGMLAPFLGAAIGAVVGGLLGGPVGILIGAAGGFAAGYGAKKLLKA